MGDEPEIPNDIPEVENETPRVASAAGVVALLIVVVALGVAIYLGIAQTAAGLFVIIGIPLVLFWFVWNVFLRRMWRLRRMRSAQEKRELLEAALRGRKQTTKDTKEHEDEV